MGKLPQEGIQSLHQTVVFGHYFLEDGIFLIYVDINVVIGQVDLEGFGFYGQK